MNAFAGDDAEREPLPLGELLVERGLLSREQLEEALAEQVQTGRQLGDIIVTRGWVPGALIGQALATQVGGLVKSEYGFATGFAPLPLPSVPLPSIAPEPVAAEELSVPPATAPAEEFSAKLASLAAPAPAPDVPAELSADLIARVAQSEQIPSPSSESLAVLEALRRERESVKELERQLQDVRMERDHAQRQHSELLSEQEQLASELAQLREQSNKQLEEITAERDGAKQQLAALLAEREQAASELTQAREELAALAAEHEHVTSELAESLEQEATRRVLDTDRHLVFAPAETGYRLVERSGPAPEPGETIELDDRRYRIVRVGIAPLPGERVACSYAIDV